MDTAAIRATIYFEPEIHKAIRLKAADTHRTLSDIVNEAVRAALREDQEDLAAFEERVAEPIISYEALLKDLKAKKNPKGGLIRTDEPDEGPGGVLLP